MQGPVTFFSIFFLISLFFLGVSIVLLIHSKFSWWRIGLYIIFWLYAMLILSKALFPIPIVEMDAASAKEQVCGIFEGINWTPFYYGPFPRNRAVFKEVVLNFLITVPVGIALPIIFNFRKRGVFISFLFCAFGIEILQLTMELLVKIPYRVIDISDVILNSGGFIFGYLLYYLSRKLICLFKER